MVDRGPRNAGSPRRSSYPDRSRTVVIPPGSPPPGSAMWLTGPVASAVTDRCAPGAREEGCLRLRQKKRLSFKKRPW